MPALKDVSFSDCAAVDTSTSPFSAFGVLTWDKLERFVLKQSDWIDLPRRWDIPLPRLPPGLRSLEVPGHHNRSFLSDYKLLAESCKDENGVPVAVPLEQLEHLRLSDYEFPLAGSAEYTTTCIIYDWFTAKLARSVSNGKLWSLDIPFDDIVQSAFDRVLDKNDIRSLSCNALSCHVDQLGLLSREGEQLVTWLDGFPNLTTVGVFPDNPSVGKTMVAKLLSRKDSKIDTIYTNTLSGVYRDEALKVAAEKGIRVVHAVRVPEPKLEPRV